MSSTAAAEVTVNPLPVALYYLELAEVRYRECTNPEARPSAAAAWRARYFHAFAMTGPGQVEVIGHSAFVRTADRLVIEPADRHERRAM